MTSQQELRTMFIELEELDGQVPLEWLTLFSVTRMQDTHQISLKFWKEQIKMFLLNFVIWCHMEVGWEEEGASGALALLDVMLDSVDVLILPTVEGAEEGQLGGCHHPLIGVSAVVTTLSNRIGMFIYLPPDYLLDISGFDWACCYTLGLLILAGIVLDRLDVIQMLLKAFPKRAFTRP